MCNFFFFYFCPNISPQSDNLFDFLLLFISWATHPCSLSQTQGFVLMWEPVFALFFWLKGKEFLGIFHTWFHILARKAAILSLNDSKQKLFFFLNTNRRITLGRDAGGCLMDI